MLLDGIANLLGAGANAYSAIKGTQLDAQNFAMQQAENQYQHGIDAWNQQFSTQQFEEQKRLNDRQFNEQSYLNRNAQQIATADAAKAGLNPMAMNGVNMSAGSAGSVAGSGVSSNAQAPQNNGLGISALADFAQNMISTANNVRQLRNAKEIADAGNKNAKDIAELQDKTKRVQLQNELDMNAEEIRHRKFLNDYEEKNGVPYEHKSPTVDAITALAGLLKNTASGTSSVAQLAPVAQSVAESIVDPKGTMDKHGYTDDEIRKMFNGMTGVSTQDKLNAIKSATGIDITRIRKMVGIY